ncbi:MAG: 3-oxoacyl-ACP reductase FabG [Candidatus Aenigmarchaeota archaeon]|nr:3-oxoacyl-ACP reductase FabG [Candidatus Aenigmarchaeota archaeon]
MDLGISGKIVLVTGGGRGIGKAVSETFSNLGATVIINYNKNKEPAESLTKKLGNGSLCIKADVSKSADVKQMFDTVKEKFGRLDILVNNAGILKDALLMMIREEDYNSIIDINLKGPFLCMQHAAKMMLRQRSGKIINISSIIGVNGNSGQTHYSASKAGLIGLTKSAAKELGRFGITVNAVAPGFIDTDMTKDMKDEIKKDLIASTSLGRIGKPEDVAKVVLFLGSNLSDYVSGQVIGVDGCQII